MSNYKLKSDQSRVAYIVRDAFGLSDVFASSSGFTSEDAAKWILTEHKPYWSREVEGYEIGVRVGEHEFFFEGEWED